MKGQTNPDSSHTIRQTSRSSAKELQPMSFTEAVGSALRQYATFSGRARRSEYWWFYLFTFLAGIAASFVDLVLGAVVGRDLGIVNLVATLAFRANRDR